MKKITVKSGDVFGKLTILSEDASNKSRRYFICLCQCGIEKSVALLHLRSGNTTSCGCYRKVASMTHGMRYTHFYEVWQCMRSRCKNENNTKYPIYGLRGIDLCISWLKFESFKKDMLESYEKHIFLHGKDNTQLERKNNDGNYCKDNCAWATRKEQARNRRTNRLVSYKGNTKCIAEWAEITGITYDAIRGRLNRGWEVEKALTEPVKWNKRR